MVCVVSRHREAVAPRLAFATCCSASSSATPAAMAKVYCMTEKRLGLRQGGVPRGAAMRNSRWQRKGQGMPDLACIQYGPVASASAQVSIQTFLQDILCGLLTFLLAFGQGLVGSDNEARSAEAALRCAIFSKAICRNQAVNQKLVVWNLEFL